MQINVPGYGLFSIGLPFSGLVAPGRVFFLNDRATLAANAGAAAAQDPTTPARTMAVAATYATANNGDVIIVGPNHSESVATMLAVALPAQTTVLHSGLGTVWGGTTFGGAVGALNGDSVVKIIKRAASLLPASTTLNIFTVVGGPVEIQDIEGIVTVILPASPATLAKLTAVPTGLAATDLCANSATLASAAVGTVLSITGVLADAMLITPAQTRIAQATRVVAYPGVIRVATTLTSATGQVAWSLRYMPLQPGAYVIAA